MITSLPKDPLTDRAERIAARSVQHRRSTVSDAPFATCCGLKMLKNPQNNTILWTQAKTGLQAVSLFR